MSGHWRIAVDSWITAEATWANRAVYTVSGDHVHSLPAALRAIAESAPLVYMAPVAEGEMLIEAAPSEFNVPVCRHGRGCPHDDCRGPEVAPEGDPSP